MLKQHLITLDYCVFLILKFLYPIGELYGEIIFYLITKCFNQDFDI